MTDPGRAAAAPPNFLAGGGEMGALIRGHDWAASPLGPPEGWPQSLKTAVRIMLTSRQPIWVGWGRELIYLYNDPYRSIIGGRHPWALGRPTREVWHEIWPEIGPMLATAMGGDEGTYVESQLLIMERYGYPEETYYTFSYSPIPDDSGNPGGIICANTEDTARVIGARQIGTLRELASDTLKARTWQDAARHSVEALGRNRQDAPFVLLYISNGDACALAGAAGLSPGHPEAPEELRPDGDVLWPVGQVIRERALLRVPVGSRFGLPHGAWDRPPNEAAVLPIVSAGDSGRTGALVVGLNPFRRFDDDYQGFLSLAAGQIAAAIGDADAHQETLRRAEALAELDRAKTAFFSNVSHEFRTPLTLMLGPLAALQEELAAGQPPPAAEQRQQLELVSRNGLRLLKLTNTLLDFARIEAGRQQAMFRPVMLGAFTAELASLFRSACERAGLWLRVECPEPAESAWVDPEMWEKIVLNLVSNAFKFTHQGGITVSLRLDERRFELEVADTGTGIAADQLPRIFDRFHRVEGAVGRTHEGSGIGLALVQELARLHAGTVEVESREGEGSRFRVVIPAGRAHLPQGQIEEASAAPANQARAAFIEEALSWLPREAGTADSEVGSTGSESSNAVTAGSDDRPRILVADDNADMRGYLARLLSDRYRVETASDGQAALESVRRNPPALVLSDMMMPRLDGFGLLAALREDAATQSVPIILLSARAGDEARLEGLKAGADDYLTKPFIARELLARVEAAIRLAEARRLNEERLAGIVDSMADGFHVIDAEGRYVRFNRAARSMLHAIGQDADALIGSRVFDAFPEALETEGGRKLAEAMESRRVTAAESYSPRFDRWYDVRNYPTEDGGVASFFQDVTNRVRHEERIRGQARIFEMIAANRKLPEVLDALLLLVESHEPGMTCSLLLAAEDRPFFRELAAPSLPAEYRAILSDVIRTTSYKPPFFAICCRTATERATATIPDIGDADGYAAAWRSMMQAAGLVACSSTPVLGSDGTLLGCLAFYFRTRRDPVPADPELVSMATHLAAIAIGRDRAVAALSESESTLRGFYDNAPMFMGVVEPTGDEPGGSDVRHIYDNPRAAAFFALPEGGTRNRLAIAEMGANPGIVREWLAHYEEAGRTGRPVRFEQRLESGNNAAWLSATVSPIGPGPSGRMRFCYIAEDISERKRAEERQTLLTNELNHRVKNTLAVIQSIATQTLRVTPDPGAFKTAFTARLMALSGAHNLLTRQAWQGADLRDVAVTALAAFRGEAGMQRVVILGPAVMLEPEAAVTLSMALHELATNAMKYGALSVPGGRVQLAWSVREPAVLDLEWREADGPKVTPPQRQGFGRRVLAASAQQLGGEIALEFPPEGVVCRMVLPLPERRPAKAAG
jgi:PAS domain S-box-containing protein